MAEFKTKDIAVSYNYCEFPSNCGIIILHNIRFNYITSAECVNRVGMREELFKAFQEHLVNTTGNTNKLVMSGIVREENSIGIYGFCKYNKWHEGQHTFNQNSGNNIVLFEFSKGDSWRRR
jgi:hypothetical protein